MKTTAISLILALISIIHIPAFGQVKRVETIGFTVSHMSKALEFYQGLLGFRLVSDVEMSGETLEQLEGNFGLRVRIVQLALGDERIELTDYLTTGGRSIPQDMRSNDLSFQHIAIVVSNMNAAYQRLKNYGVEWVSTAPQTLPKNNLAAAGIRAVYFRDPDGHNLELIFFPPGKGQEKWQHPQHKLFLGIDHTAIGISNTSQSLHFYEQLLGITKKGESLNEGTEQEHLNQVEGSAVHITGLRSISGPGIEFLEYLKPGTGKPYPADTQSSDLWYWQTTVLVQDAAALYEKLRGAQVHFVSHGLVSLPAAAGNRGSKAFIARDPDGHALLIKD